MTWKHWKKPWIRRSRLQTSPRLLQCAQSSATAVRRLARQKRMENHWAPKIPGKQRKNLAGPRTKVSMFQKKLPKTGRRPKNEAQNLKTSGTLYSRVISNSFLRWLPNMTAFLPEFFLRDGKQAYPNFLQAQNRSPLASPAIR